MSEKPNSATPATLAASPGTHPSLLQKLAPFGVGLLLAAAYGSTLWGIAGSWFDPNLDMGHGPAVPFAAGFMAWSKRDDLARLPANLNFWGLLVVLWGATQFIVSSAADWIFLTRSSFLITLAGCVLCLWGTRVLRELAYPLAVLSLMIAPPTFLQERVTFPLQLIASRLAEFLLDMLGYSVLREGNILELVGERLAVAEACSGIRSLYSLFFFCTVYNFFFVGQTSIRWVMMLAIVPIAILGNALRIVATGVVGQYDRALAHGMLHEAWGYMSVMLAGGMMIGLHILIQQGQRFGRRAHAG